MRSYIVIDIAWPAKTKGAIMARMKGEEICV